MTASQQPAALNETAVFSLLDYIETELDLAGTFELTIEALCARLGIPLVDAYRVLYQSTGTLSGYVPKCFNIENMNILVMFLSRLSEIDVEEVFRAAGAGLSSDDLSELAALYYDTANVAIAGHTPRKDEYGQMCARFKTRRRAFDVYIDYFFDVHQIFENTVSAFVSARNYTFPVLGRSSAHRSLTLLVKRHIISISTIFEGLYDCLTGESKGRAGATTGRSGVDNTHISLPALRAMGLTRPPTDRRELRLHYKTLMKTYHPDVNPEGLEMSKKINTAYAEILTSWSLSH